MIWLTRPREDSEAMAASLQARKLDCIVAPVMEIAPCPFTLPLSVPASILITSRHAVSALPDAWRDVPIYAVGEATAEALRARGYGQVITGDGNVLALLPALAAAKRDVLYLSGEDVKLDLAPLLAAQGVHLQRIVVYAATPARLEASFVDALRSGAVRAAVFYSPHTVRVAGQLLAQAQCMDRMADVDAFCLSMDIAVEAAKLGCARLLTCAVPTQQAMMELLSATAIRAA